MNTHLTPRFAALLAAGLCLSLAGFSQETSNSSSFANPEQIEKLNPFTVSALYAAVEIQFTLSGQNLFNPLADPVESAEITAVVIRDPDDVPDVAVGDRLLRIGDVELKGRTIPQIAELLSAARAKGVPTWETSRTVGTTSFKFDGDWITPLPGLKR